MLQILSTFFLLLQIRTEVPSFPSTETLKKDLSRNHLKLIMTGLIKMIEYGDKILSLSVSNDNSQEVINLNEKRTNKRKYIHIRTSIYNSVTIVITQLLILENESDSRNQKEEYLHKNLEYMHHETLNDYRTIINGISWKKDLKQFLSQEGIVSIDENEENQQQESKTTVIESSKQRRQRILVYRITKNNEKIDEKKKDLLKYKQKVQENIILIRKKEIKIRELSEKVTKDLDELSELKKGESIGEREGGSE